jgi:hypothetical protein
MNRQNYRNVIAVLIDPGRDCVGKMPVSWLNRMGVWALASCRLASLNSLGGRKRCRVYLPSAQLAAFIGLFRVLAPHVEPVFQDGASNASVYATLPVVIILVANFQELPPGLSQTLSSPTWEPRYRALPGSVLL